MTRIIILDPIQILDIFVPENNTPPHNPSDLDHSDEQPEQEASSYRNGTPTDSYNDLNLPAIQFTPAPRLEQEPTQETYLSSEPSTSEDPQQFYSSLIAEHNRHRPHETPVHQRIPQPHTPPPIQRRTTSVPQFTSPPRPDTPTPGPSRLRRIGRRIRSSFTSPRRQTGSPYSHYNSSHPN